MSVVCMFVVLREETSFRYLTPSFNYTATRVSYRSEHSPLEPLEIYLFFFQRSLSLFKAFEENLHFEQSEI